MPPTIKIIPPAINFDQDPMIFEVETTRKTGTAPNFTFTESNLSSYMQVMVNYDNDNEGEVLLVELEPNYNTADGNATVDLRGLIDLSITPPIDGHIDFAPLAAPFTPAGVLGKASATMKVNVGDQFGAPVAVEGTLTQSATFTVVKGSSRYWQGFQGLYTGPLILLNSMKSFNRLLSNTITKDIYLGQPEFISFYANADQNLTITAKITLEDNSVVDNVVISTVALKKGCNYVGVSLRQTKILDNYPTVKKYILSFGALNIGNLHYRVLTHEPDPITYLVFETGTGGIETAALVGKQEREQEVTFATQEKPVWKGDNPREGTITSTFKTGKETLVLNTGYHSADYIEHLSQIIYADYVWIIDRVRSKFIRVQVTSTSAKIKDSNSDLYAFDITIKQATRSYNHHTFNI